MDVARLGEAALTGWRKTVGDAAARFVSARTPLSAAQVRGLVGALFFVLAVRYVVGTARRARKGARG